MRHLCVLAITPRRAILAVHTIGTVLAVNPIPTVLAGCGRIGVKVSFHGLRNGFRRYHGILAIGTITSVLAVRARIALFALGQLAGFQFSDALLKGGNGFRNERAEFDAECLYVKLHG